MRNILDLHIKHNMHNMHILLRGCTPLMSNLFCVWQALIHKCVSISTINNNQSEKGSMMKWLRSSQSHNFRHNFCLNLQDSSRGCLEPEAGWEGAGARTLWGSRRGATIILWSMRPDDLMNTVARQGTSSQYQYCYLDLVIWYFTTIHYLSAQPIQYK